MTDGITGETIEGMIAETITEMIGGLETIVVQIIAVTADPSAHDRHPEKLKKLLNQGLH
jgi:hypothetical protein